MSVKDGKILTGDLAIVNQILPHKNKWAWDLFLKGQKNNWVPSEIPMNTDIDQWKSRDVLSEDERLLLKRCLGFFAGSESLVSNNLLINIFRIISDAECRQYLLRQSFEESLHNQTIVYICDSLGLDINEVYEAYQNIPSIKAKDDFLMRVTTDMGNNFDLENRKQDAIRNLFAYYILCEGIFFYSGFAMLLAFGRENKLPGVSQQIQLTMKDESLHIEFGTTLINKIIEQEENVWSSEFKELLREDARKATELEIQYAKDVLPNGILGLNSDLFIGYMQYIANRRLEGVGLKPLFKNPKNPFPWMLEIIDLPKLKNFFERTVTEYQTGGLKDDF